LRRNDNAKRYTLFRFEAFDATAGVFTASFFQVDIAYICERAEPGKDIGKFFLFIFLVIRDKGGSKLSDFFNKPHKGGRNSSLLVSLFVFPGDYALKFANMHFINAQEHKRTYDLCTFTGGIFYASIKFESLAFSKTLLA